jgi:hypothetical protein
MTTVDIADLFDVRLPAAITRDPNGARAAIRFKFQVNVTDLSGGAWAVDGTVPEPTCVRGSVAGPDVLVLNLTQAQFQDLCVFPRRKCVAVLPNYASSVPAGYPWPRFMSFAMMLGLVGIA